MSKEKMMAEYFPSNGWILANGKKPELPDGTLVDVRFADGTVSTGHIADSWIWTQDGEYCDITHYRIHQPAALEQDIAALLTTHTPEAEWSIGIGVVSEIYTHLASLRGILWSPVWRTSQAREEMSYITSEIERIILASPPTASKGVSDDN